MEKLANWFLILKDVEGGFVKMDSPFMKYL